MTARRVTAAVIALVLATTTAACSSSSKDHTITVFAASSLQGTFTTLAKQFEQAHPHTKVVLNFNGSSALAASIVNGAPADVFASAAPKNMSTVISAGGATTSVVFARNELEIVVPLNNPKKIAVLADLARKGVRVALCDPKVPCGATTAQVLAGAKITIKPTTLEPDVKSTLAKVTLKEVDAGIVYVTDVLAAGATVRGVVIPTVLNRSTDYPIAAIKNSHEATLAKQFVDLVTSAAGQKVLQDAGFQTP